MAKKTQTFAEDFAFYEQLRYFYALNRNKIRARYNDLTKKFLAYNDKNENHDAFLRQPQFEALEMYVFIKEFLDNAQMHEIFDAWRKRQGDFSDASYYTIRKDGQGTFMDIGDEQNEAIFKQMEKYREKYPNYIYALTMGLGKTILIATCIFYEFLLANKYPKDKRFCHNALVFAPDKTVLESLREIQTFDKIKVVPPEYIPMLDSKIRFHFMDDSRTTLHTIDYSNFNIIISNNQKIIVKKKHKEEKPGKILYGQGSLLETIYGDDDDDIQDDTSLNENQRFKKLCRLPQLGVYVDEAHHLFGANLEKELRDENPDKTSLRNTINLLADKTNIVACYNFTGTPYVNNQVLPEVVYAYGLKKSIENGFLKDAVLSKFENVKDKEFLRITVKKFWELYGGKTYDGLTPKLAIFAATVEEAIKVVQPTVEKVLSELGISNSAILVNTGDPTVTKDEDIHNFNNLDKPKTEGNRKQFIILVEKGREGWNCHSLLGVALFRSPKSRIFVLQATMRCLRQLTEEQLKASVFLSKENYEILDDELKKNYDMEISDFRKTSIKKKNKYKVRVLPPEITIPLKRIWHEYKTIEKEYKDKVKFDLENLDKSKYEMNVYEKDILHPDEKEKKQNIDELKEKVRYSKFSLIGEISRYMNIPCLKIEKILCESEDGIDEVLKAVNQYNEIIYDVIVPCIFHALYYVKCIQHSENVELVLLHEPKNGFYEFSATEDLVIKKDCNDLKDFEVKKSFHADTYCFDSKPERECFLKYITDKDVKEIYFTGMFTSPTQSDLYVPYFDPDSKRIRNYYPDFLAKMKDGSYELIEVKGDNMINKPVVKAKAEAAEEMAVASGIKYSMYEGSSFSKSS